MNPQDPSSVVDGKLIGSTTSVEDIIQALGERNCPDLTSSIDLSACSNVALTGGGSCDMYQGKLRDGTKIAIKAMRVFNGPGKDNAGEKILKRAARELYHWSRMRHPNVLPLMGLALFRGQMAMISEWMDNGSLTLYLRLQPEADRIKLCMDICAGLCYIHADDMVHGDLKAANVMVSSDGIAMIADFGSSQLKDLTLRFTNTTSSKFSVRWAAPELLTEDTGSCLSKKTDVYAYGMTVLETLTDKVPYEDIGEPRVVFLVGVYHKTPDRPTVGISDKLWGILQQCWTPEPSKRPGIISIGKQLLAMSDPTPNMQATDESKHCQLASLGAALSNVKLSDAPTGSYNDSQGMLKHAECQRTMCSEGSGSVGEELLHSRELAAYQKELGEDHPKTLASMASLAAIYDEQGQLAKSELLQTQLLAAYQRTLGKRHPDTLKCMIHLGAIYHKQGNLAKAEPLQLHALASCERVLGGDDPDTIQSMANLAATYYKQGKLSEAELLQIQALRARQRVLGRSHPDTIKCMARLAMTYFKQGRLEETESLEVEVLAARTRVFGEDHTETIQSMANLATTYLKQGQIPKAEELQTRVLAARRRSLGDNHPDTLKGMARLALTYSKQGRLVEAEKLEVQVLVTRERLLGECHNDTITSMADLAATYYEQGRYTEAEPLQARLLSICKKHFGEAHPDTLRGLRSLARTFKAQGRRAEYKALASKVSQLVITPRQQ